MEQEFKNLQGKGADAFGGIPENYFRDLPDKILLRSKTGSRKVFYLRPSLIAAAASLLVLVGLAIVLIFTNNTPGPDYAYDNRPSDSVRQMIASGGLANNTAVKDSAESFPVHNGSVDDSAENPAERIEDIFNSLDDIPVDILIDFLLISEEYTF